VRSSRGNGERMVVVSDCSGFVISAWVLASAAAIAPIVSPLRCVSGLCGKKIKADGA